MALPAHILQRLPAELKKNGLVRSGDSLYEAQREQHDGQDSARELWQRVLRTGEFPSGGVVELALGGGLALGTSLALRACEHAQRESLRLGTEACWCAFVDPSSSLYAPGVERFAIDLQRLLVLRPDLDALSRVVLRLVESRVFRVVVIDLVGAGQKLDIDLGSWVRVVRRLSLALEQSEATVLLLTEASARRPVPLPVAQRLELVRKAPRVLQVNVTKDRLGYPCGPVRVSWSAPRSHLDERGPSHAA